MRCVSIKSGTRREVKGPGKSPINAFFLQPFSFYLFPFAFIQERHHLPRGPFRVVRGKDRGNERNSVGTVAENRPAPFPA